MKALEVNGFSWKAVSLHDASGGEPGKIYACGSSLFRFMANVIRLTDRGTVVVWNHVSLAALLPFLKPLLWNRGNILITYGTEAWDETLSPWKKRSFAFMDEIWTISSYTKEKMIRSHGLDDAKIRVFPCCISNREEKYFSDPYPTGRFDIMTLLRLDRSRKLSAVFNIVDALPVLQEKGVPVHFTVVGRGNDEENVRRYVEERGMMEHVTFTGFVKDARPYLKYCDLFTLISDGEGFGIVYLEAMEYGKCCVAAKDCGSQDVVLDGKTGVSVAVDDIPAVEMALLKLAGDDNLRNSMGEKGQNHLFQNFTFDSFMKNQRNLLERWGK
jgi:phosphatidyl-myo-inositol dimannoside synthase